MTIKIYDKTLDLMGRDGSRPVGSRFATILGSRMTPGLMEQSMKLARFTGLTRVEVSLHLDQEGDMTLSSAHARLRWHVMIPAMIKLIIERALNHWAVIDLAYRALNMP